jgi:chromosome segregation ATPase
MSNHGDGGAGEEKPAKGNFFGNLLVKAGVLEVAEDAQTDEAAVSTPVKKTVAVQQPSIEAAVGAPAMSADNVLAEAKVLSEKYLNDVLAATSDKFREFLETRAAMREGLADTLSGDALEAKAISLAVKSTKLTSDEVPANIAKAGEALKKLRANFASELGTARVKQVDGPTADIQSTETEIGRLEAQRASITKQIVDLQAGIDAKRQEITAAARRLQNGEQLFDDSCEIVEGRLANMETQLLTAHKGGKS